MSNEISKAQDIVSAGSIVRPQSTETVGAGGVYTTTCIGPNGQVKWTDTFHNLVVNEGLQYMNATTFEGAGYTAAWYLGLVDGSGTHTYAAGNTLTSHATWTELVPGTAYTTSGGSVRAGVTWNATSPTNANPSVASNSNAPSSFTMLVNGTVVAGALLCTVNSGTSGVLFSVGNFTGGNKSVDAGDTLNVTYSFSLTAT
jgi:hypothetical protein